MLEHTMIGLVSIIVLGISAQWLALKLRIPSILFLLAFGFIAGPITGFLHPDEIFGEMLFPFISLSVAIILFEGGMGLNFRELKEIGGVLTKLITIGAVVTWILISITAHYLLGLNLPFSVLMGAILVVTGPTVIGPLLRHVRPTGRVANVVKWEGIMNDPVGAILAVLVFESILLVENWSSAGIFVLTGVFKTIFVATIISFLAARTLIFMLKRYWIPDSLHQAVTLMIVVFTFALSNHLAVESGILEVTLLGIFLTNQHEVSIRHIIEFKETLRDLIIGTLFIILAARLDLQLIGLLGWPSIVFVGVLMFVVRPLAVYFSTRKSDFTWKEKLFVSWMAPRGIVAAAVVSLFSFELAKSGFEQTEILLPLTFLVIVSTVTVYGLTAGPLARWLGLAQSNPQGVLILGAHLWARKITKLLKEQGIKIIMVDTNAQNIRKARAEGLDARVGNVLTENFIEHFDFNGLGYFMSLTSNDEANALASIRLKEVFSMSNLYQIFPENPDGPAGVQYSPRHLHARFLFEKGLDSLVMNRYFREGGQLDVISFTDEFDYEAFMVQQTNTIIPMFIINEDNRLTILDKDSEQKPQVNDRLIFMRLKQPVQVS